MSKIKKKKGIGGKIVTTILVLIVFFSIAVAICNFVTYRSLFKYAVSFAVAGKEVSLQDNSIKPVYNSDSPIKVLDLTDIHISSGILTKDEDMAAIDTIVEKVETEKPDLVIISGDTYTKKPWQSGTFNNKYAAEILVSLMEALGVYYIPCFSNEDATMYTLFDSTVIAETFSSSNSITSLYKGRDIKQKDFGRYAISVINSKNQIIQEISVLDSHGYIQKELFSKKEDNSTEKDASNVIITTYPIGE